MTVSSVREQGRCELLLVLPQGIQSVSIFGHTSSPYCSNVLNGSTLSGSSAIALQMGSVKDGMPST